MPKGSINESPTELRPQYIVKVDRNPYSRGIHWAIQSWNQNDTWNKNGFWGEIAYGVAYTKWGLWRQVNKKLISLNKTGRSEYYNIDKTEFRGIK